MRLLLHACCGPCSLEPTRLLKEQGIDFGIDYTNPNIHPADEYEHRLQTLQEFVTIANSIPLVAAGNDVEEWEREVAIHGTDREARCRACYRLRFQKVARHAVEHGYDAISTTLTISPYQYTQIILEELQRAAAEQGLDVDAKDYSWCYKEATRRSKQMGMYRQNYCGCRFSIAEAELERRQAAEKRARLGRTRHLAKLMAAAQGCVDQANQL